MDMAGAHADSPFIQKLMMMQGAAYHNDQVLRKHAQRLHPNVGCC